MTFSSVLPLYSPSGRVDELVLDELPEDAGHLIAVQLGDGVLHFDFLCCEPVTNGPLSEG